MKLKLLVGMIALSLSLFSCASISEGVFRNEKWNIFEDNLYTFIDEPENKLVALLGVPDANYKLDDGHKIVSYIRQYDYDTETTESSTRSYYSEYDKTTYSYATAVTTIEHNQNKSQIDFIVNKGVVINIKYKGNFTDLMNICHTYIQDKRRISYENVITSIETIKDYTELEKIFPERLYWGKLSMNQVEKWSDLKHNKNTITENVKSEDSYYDRQVPEHKKKLMSYYEYYVKTLSKMNQQDAKKQIDDFVNIMNTDYFIDLAIEEIRAYHSIFDK